MGMMNSNLNKQMRRKYANLGRKVTYLRRRSARAELTPGQKFRMVAAEAELRKLARYASTG